ncbi:MAG: IS630 family transposase, partial [Chloroflexi bacterium]
GLSLTDEDRRILEGWVRAHSTSQQVVKRARIILLAAEGMSNDERQLKLPSGDN